jgi:hypothetical protein
MTSEEQIRRNLVVLRWGTPARTVGSLNEPREMEEHGVTFNEKWQYRIPKPGGGGTCERHVYWLRYDFVASFLADRDGTVTREDAIAFLAGLNAREYVARAPHDIASSSR